jgi:glycosyltransferase involved in cell wall biosynthesis
MSDNLASVSFVIPTLNSERVLDKCLKSIRIQDYPADKIEVIIVDAGSTDKTLEIAKKYQVDKVLDNPLQTGEAGKAVGIGASTNEIIALIDSDNLLDGREWLRKMVKPFENSEIVSSEVLYWTYRRDDSLVDRYCALTGINDPVCLFLGNYDRYSYLSGKWTELLLEEETDRGAYLEVVIDKDNVPTMGANGYLVRREILNKIDWHPYYFDIDAAYQLIQLGYSRIARPKIGIIHLYCDKMSTFYRKQSRRINDYFYFRKKRIRHYKYNIICKGYVKYLLYTILIFPLLCQSLKGYLKKPDIAWFFHPLACWITLFVYSWGTIKGVFKAEIHDRGKWSQ